MQNAVGLVANRLARRMSFVHKSQPKHVESRSAAERGGAGTIDALEKMEGESLGSRQLVSRKGNLETKREVIEPTETLPSAFVWTADFVRRWPVRRTTQS